MYCNRTTSSKRGLAELKWGTAAERKMGGGNSSEQDADIIHIDSAFVVLHIIGIMWKTESELCDFTSQCKGMKFYTQWRMFNLLSYSQEKGASDAGIRP